MADERLVAVVVKKTVYLEQDLIKQLKLKAIYDDSTESKTLNSILRSYFKKKNK